VNSTYIKMHGATMAKRILVTTSVSDMPTLFVSETLQDRAACCHVH